MTVPVDGYGLYESVAPSAGSGVWQPRLDQIAAAGFKLVMNGGLPYGHTTDITAYINYAATKGLKVIVALHDPRIWRDNTYAANYTLLYADSGNAATGILFAQYLVNQVKGLAGVWGYYIGDEVAAVDHTTFATYAAAIKTSDSTHPRLIVTAGGSAGNTAGGTTLYYDSCEVLGDDYYPIRQIPLPTTFYYALTTAQTAAAIQTFDNTKSLQSVMVLQAHSLDLYGSPGFPWPNAAQMLQMRNDAVGNMTPRLILWYSYIDATSPSAPTSHWADLASVVQGAYGPVFSMVGI